MKKNFKKIAVTMLSIFCICIVGTTLAGCKKKPFELSTTIEQIDNSQAIKVSWESDKIIDEVTIVLKHGNDVEKTITINNFDGQTTNDAIRGEKENSITIDTFYGRHTVEITAKSGKRTTETTKTIDVYTDEYNIAPLVATVPVSVYTLSMKEYTNNYEIPTFFWLQRANAWDYEHLPENVYPIPTATAEEITTEYSSAMSKKTIAWVKELYTINNDSKFNFFCNDYWSKVWIQSSYGNGIPASNFKVTLLSDGTASYSMFNKYYNDTDAETTYNTYSELWEDFKAGTVKDLTTEQCRALTYVWIQDNDIDVTWVINRVDTIGQANETVKTKINELYSNNKIKRYYLDNLWKALSNDEKAQLKKLYHIGDAFAEAEKAGKTPMVILGTSNSAETDLETYITLIKKYYGNDYAYFYKGHPAYPTNAYPEKQALLERLGVAELESSIPAEFFYYFYPNVAYSGYGSSTFLVGDEPSKAVFTKYESCDATYKDNLEIFISKLSSTDDVYGTLITAGDTDKYLIQDVSNFNKSLNKFTQIKIYDASDKTFEVYNLVDGSYVKA